jgi:NAD(P)H-dependent FMN reductase
MDEQIVIAVIAGTARVQRKSVHAARYVAEFGKRLPNVEIIFVDPTDFTLPGDGNDPEGKDPRYTDITVRADAFFVVSPEYNHSFPGSLKRLLDSELENYNHKPVALAGASDGNWGGVRAVEALTLTVREMGLVVISISPYFPFVDKMFTETGEIDPAKKERVDRNLQRAYDELLWLARPLKAARHSSESGSSTEPEASK